MRIYLLTLSLLATTLLFAQARRVPVEPALQSVTIFSKGARVERSASTTLSPGRSEVVFSGMSNGLDPQSVQLKADANITLLSVKATRDFLSERRIDEEERSFIDRIRQLTQKKESDEKQLEVYTREEEMVVKNESIGGSSGVKAAELKAALDLHRQRLSEIYDKQLEIGRRIQATNAELARLNAQLREFGKKRDSIQYIVTALVDTKESRTVKFRLFYNVQEAGWYPTYDVRVTEVGRPLQLLMNANVSQRSGESWKDVSLLLSTGNPNDNATPSQLQPWMLSFYDPAVGTRTTALGDVSGRVFDETGAPVPFATITAQSTRSSVTADGNGYFRISNVPQNSNLLIYATGYVSRSQAVKTGYYNIQMQRAGGEMNEVVVTAMGIRKKASETGYSQQVLEGRVDGMQIGGVQTAYNPTTIIYQVAEKYSLETDGKVTTIGIKQLEVPATYDYVATPKIDPAAFLNARIAGWQELDLISGEAGLYFEGAYLGKTYLDLGSATDTLTLSLGKDNGIRITRKLVKEYSTKKFLGSNRIDSRSWEIAVRNNKRVPINITFTDQVPVSTVKEIIVDEKEIKTDGQLNTDTGIITWQLEVPAATEKKLSFSYEVKYPKERRVTLE